jgi:DNA-binding transcriptional MerR regulator
MLTIGQLADYVGVTVRAIRHYHDRRLLAEPARDSSGYRRYGAQAVLDLTRIKILAGAGVPLARIDELLSAGPEQLAESVAQIDAALQQQIRDLECRRQRIAALLGGERMYLPAELVGLLDQLRAAGISSRTVEIERDSWILLLAGYPERAAEWLEEKRANLADPEFQRLYRGFDQAVDWDPADPRLEELADAIARYGAQHSRANEAARRTLDDPTVRALLASQFDSAASPALERLNELTEGKLARPWLREEPSRAPS